MKYKAFISYRHLEPDKTVAIELQKLLERVKLPKGEASWRIFRDESELPTSSNLSDDIDAAHKESEYLIVICSEALKQSKWCLQEIDTFKRIHDGKTDNIFTVLVSGTPGEAFPDALCHSNKEVIIDGVASLVDVEVEPLAANVTADNASLMKKKLKTEYLRIAAPMLGVSFDQLFDRKRRSRTNRLIATCGSVATIVTAVSVIFAAYNSNMNAKINEQLKLTEIENEKYLEQLELTNQEKEKFESQLEQTRLENAKNYNLQAKSYKELYKDRDAIESVLKAYEMTDDHEPLFAESNLILADAIGAYKERVNFPAVRLVHDEYVNGLWMLAGGKRIVTTDSGNNVYVWDAETGECVWKSKNKVQNDSIFVNNSRVMKRSEGIHNANSEIISAKMSYVSESYLSTGYERTNPENDLICDDDFFVYKIQDGEKYISSRVNVIDGTETVEYETEDYGTYKKLKNGFSVFIEGRFSLLGDEEKPTRLIVHNYYDKKTKTTVIPESMNISPFDYISATDDYIFVKDSDNSVRYLSYDDDTVSELSEPIVTKMASGHTTYEIYDLGDYLVIEERTGGIYDTDYAKLTFFDVKTMQKKWEYEAKVMGSKIYDVGLLNHEIIEKSSDVLFYIFSNKIQFIDANTGRLITDGVFDEGILDYYYTDKGYFYITLINGRTELVSLGWLENDSSTILLEENMPEIKYHAYDGGHEAIGYEYSKYIDVYSQVENDDCKVFFEEETNEENHYANSISSVIMIDDYSKAVIRTNGSVFIYDFNSGEKRIIDEVKRNDDADDTEKTWESATYENLNVLGDKIYIKKSGISEYRVYDINSGEVIGNTESEGLGKSILFPKNADFTVSIVDNLDKSEKELVFFDGVSDSRISLSDKAIQTLKVFSTDDGNVIIYFENFKDENGDDMCNMHFYDKLNNKELACILLDNKEVINIDKLSIRSDGRVAGYINRKEPYKYALADTDSGEIRYIDVYGSSVVDIYLGNDKIYLFLTSREVYVYDYDGNKLASIDIGYGHIGTLSASSKDLKMMIEDDVLLYQNYGTIWLIDTVNYEAKRKMYGLVYDPIHRIIIGEKGGALFAYPAYTGKELYNKAMKMIGFND